MGSQGTTETVETKPSHPRPEPGLPPAAARALAGARAAGREVLLEPEALAVAAALGVEVPAHTTVADAAAARRADLSRLPGDRVVVKVLSPEILHKSDVGGVAVVAKDPPTVAAAVAAMAERLAAAGLDRRVAGYGLFEHVAHDPSFGGELLLGLRWTEDFGPVVTCGAGGLFAEHLEAHLRPGRGVAILSPGLTRPEELPRILAGKALTAALTGTLRGRPPRLAPETLQTLLVRALDLAASLPAEVCELEINPLVTTGRGLVALDALVRLGRRPAAGAPEPDPAWENARRRKLARLFRPRSLAVVGVSARRRNPGRIVLDNVLSQGFERRRIFVVKPGVEHIDGCRAVPDLASLPEPVDVLVLAVDAAQVPALMDDAVAGDRAAAVILLPGGLGETEGSGARAARLTSRLAAARRDGGRGPVVVGGNCLGVRSVPGRYNTLFIPRPKLRFPQGNPAPLAILSQSGAFAVARSGKLAGLDPLYVVSYGNQLDVTVGDLLDHLRTDGEVEVFACYVEGFRPGDGRRFLEAAREITAAGRTVILYRAGRTAAGARATASHTAVLAGDYAVTRELAAAAGVVMAESLEDFEDLARLFCALSGRRPRGRRLGAVSNAGFECVAVADSLGPFELARFGAATESRLGQLLAVWGLAGVVGLKNPLDLTPIVGDEGFAAAVRAVLEDDGVDLRVVGCVPLTGALSTLAAEPAAGSAVAAFDQGHGEDAAREGSVARRLAALFGATSKPWVAVVDGGPLYDPMTGLLTAAGLPVFRSADRALRLLALWWRRWAEPVRPAPPRQAARRGLRVSRKSRSLR